MNSHQFIDQLTNNLKPVSTVNRPASSLGIFVFISFSWLVLGIFYIGFRTDLSIVIDQFSFWFATLLILLIALASGITSLIISIPDRYNRFVYIVPVTSAFLCFGSLIFSMISSDHHHIGEGLYCVRDILLFSIVPTFLLIRMVSKGSVLQRKVAGAFSLLSGTAIGAFGTQFTCRDEFGLHLFVWHFLPVAIFVLTGYLLGKIIFRSGISIQ